MKILKSLIWDCCVNSKLISDYFKAFFTPSEQSYSIIAFDFEYSILCAALKKSTKHLGLSIGDRACISLGIKLGLPVYTADKIWAELKLENANIRLI